MTENGPVLNARMKYFKDPEFIRTMPLLRRGKKFISSLLKVADVYFVTSVNIECLTARAEALAESFPKYRQQTIFLLRQKIWSRWICFLTMLRITFSARRKSNVPVLFRRPWNSHLSGLPAVDNYGGFLDFVNHVRNAYTAVPPKFESGIVCIVGLPGSGKTEIVDGLKDIYGAKKIQSFTTRSGCDDKAVYHCVCAEEFQMLKAQKKFVQTSVYGGDFYGITREEIINVLNEERIGVVAVDICGAVSIKAQFPNRTAILFVNGSHDAAIADIIDDDSLTTNQKVFRINGVSAEEKTVNLPISR